MTTPGDGVDLDDKNTPEATRLRGRCIQLQNDLDRARQQVLVLQTNKPIDDAIRDELAALLARATAAEAERDHWKAKYDALSPVSGGDI